MSTFSAAATPPQPEDSTWMRHAIHLALRARGQTHPNPLVGAVIVSDNGTLLSEGWHAQDGGPHAEIAALHNLQKCSDQMQQNNPTAKACCTTAPDRSPATAQGATLYVTLEPCSTRGRTGACTDAIIRAGIARVVIGAIDPYPGHGGNAITVLAKAGIAVTSGVLADECADLNLIFNHRVATGQPLIAAKVAVTLDGKIATRSHDSRWITGEASRADVMLWRRTFPAIGVGAGTVLADNPSLTARLPQPATPAANTADCSATGNPANIGYTATDLLALAAAAQTAPPESIWCPRRLIFDRSGRTANFPEATVFTDAFAHRTLVITAEGAPAKRLREAGIAIAALPAGAFASSHFAAALRELLIREQLAALYVEGGGGLLSELLNARALDYLFSYRAPKLLADALAVSPFGGQSISRMASALTLHSVRHATFGDDQLMRGHIVYPQPD